MTTTEQIQQQATILRTRAATQPVRHLADLYVYAADALDGIQSRSDADRASDIERVVKGLGMAARGWPEAAADVADVCGGLAAIGEAA